MHSGIAIYWSVYTRVDYTICFWTGPTVPHWRRGRVSKKLFALGMSDTCLFSTDLLFYCICLVVKNVGRDSLMKPATRESSCCILYVFDYSLIQWHFRAKSFWLRTSRSMSIPVLRNIKDYATILSIGALLLPSPLREQKHSLKEEITYKAFFEVHTIEVQYLSTSYTSMTILAAKEGEQTHKNSN